MRRDAARNRLSRRFVVAAALVVLASVQTTVGPATPPAATVAEPVCTVSAKFVNSCRPGSAPSRAATE
jgi:hypothetical protein